MDESEDYSSLVKGLLGDVDDEDKKRIRAAFQRAINEAEDKKTVYNLLGSFQDIPKGFAGGGRIGLDTQLGQGRLGAGLTGNMIYLPEAGLNRYRPTGWDISYSTPNNVFSLLFNKPMPVQTPTTMQEIINPFTMPPNIMFNYLRRY